MCLEASRLTACRSRLHTVESFCAFFRQRYQINAHLYVNSSDVREAAHDCFISNVAVTNRLSVFFVGPVEDSLGVYRGFLLLITKLAPPLRPMLRIALEGLLAYSSQTPTHDTLWSLRLQEPLGTSRTRPRISQAAEDFIRQPFFFVSTHLVAHLQA